MSEATDFSAALDRESPLRGNQNEPSLNDHQMETQNWRSVNAAPVLKYDVGKPPVWRGALSYFPRALAKIADVSGYGAIKYSWGAWRKVQDANRMERYADAMVRHQLAVAKEGWQSVDPETGHLHLAHMAWNALALLELTVEEQENATPAKNGASLSMPRPGSLVPGDRYGLGIDVV